MPIAWGESVSIQFRCDQCGREYDLPDMAAGKKAKCECGVLLVVPMETQAADSAETFDPSAASEAPSPPVPKPPRTLAAAAKQAAPPPPVANEPPLAEPPPVPPAEPKPEPPPVAPPPPAAEAEMPPPLPPAYQPTATPEPPIEKRYRNLRAHCGWLRLLSWMVIAAAGLATVSQLLLALPTIDRLAANPLLAIPALLPILFYAVIGVGFFIGINAAAELIHVLMDIEENTRRPK